MKEPESRHLHMEERHLATASAYVKLWQTKPKLQ